MLKSLALKIPRVKALVVQRDALLSERDQLLKAQGDLLLERDRIRSAQEQRFSSEEDKLIESQSAARLNADELIVSNTQLSDALKHAAALPIPPRHLQVRVVGGYYPAFLSSATRTLSEFNGILKTAGKSLADFDRVLDLGVGCGRVLRRFHELYPKASLTGADIDAEAIAWLQHNYARVGKFVTLPHLPPSELETDSFELAYAVSVFTHLNEEMQFAWLDELSRVTKRGAYILLTVHGDIYQAKSSAGYSTKNIGKGNLLQRSCSRDRGAACVLPRHNSYL